MKASKAGIAFLIVFVSCIDPFGVSSLEPEGLLNIEAFLTSEPHVQQIRLSRAGIYGLDNVGRNLPVRGAVILVKDDLGNIERFLESGVSGTYLSSSEFSTKVGRSYNLDIELPNGERLVSLPELVNPVPKMDSVTYRAVRTASTDPMNDEIGVQVLGHFQDPADQQNFYYWKMLESDFVLITEPELYTLPPTHPTCPRCPVPKDCCSRCFHKDTPRPANINTIDDLEFNGNYQSRVIAYVRDNGLRFKETYRLDIQHMSVSAEAHRFLKLSDQQLRLTGSVFDPPPANIRGNVINLNRPEEQVLGYFFATDIQLLRVYIRRDNLEFFLRPQTTVPDDCRDYLQQASGFPMPFLPTEAPEDWDGF
ncbi:hypothetical protein A33Q_4500 [Indibacter alkaliphilus LW1]|uniref:DUF4249 domain-containing protein n=1 Tax=Indibacter alkaliphilus (strain CCUG 57479 / KCTC 22604 / LW1) TaxID=1189612 RepID=S2CZ27_INDAL|nr:DUF4249 domain-containing protein [Indibacter alkaliphilus]EOZ92407.1 hypothetical protein A33Q_4500 [Indibacter alkaliphilus LW1]